MVENFGNPIYVLESGNETIGSMSITESHEQYDCDIIYTLYVFDDSSTSWVDAGTDSSLYDFINAFDTSSGTLEVNSSNTGAYSNEKDFQMKITATSTETMDSH